MDTEKGHSKRPRSFDSSSIVETMKTITDEPINELSFVPRDFVLDDDFDTTTTISSSDTSCHDRELCVHDDDAANWTSTCCCVRDDEMMMVKPAKRQCRGLLRSLSSADLSQMVLSFLVEGIKKVIYDRPLLLLLLLAFWFPRYKKNYPP